jgi:c-di-GMP-binding flagellar brake protein YcgR
MVENNSHKEKRKHMRVAFDAYILASLTAEKGHTEKIFTTKNMSPEGIFLASRESLPVGTILSLTIHAPTSSSPINAQAQVVRVAKDDKDQPVGMGLVFLEMPDTDKKELLKNLYLVYQHRDNKDNK